MDLCVHKDTNRSDKHQPGRPTSTMTCGTGSRRWRKASPVIGGRPTHLGRTPTYLHCLSACLHASPLIITIDLRSVQWQFDPRDHGEGHTDR
jgi:hypothetical protein